MDTTTLGQRHTYGGQRSPFVLDEPDRARHVFLLGKSGTGKSTALLNLLIQDLYTGAGFTLIDPHGELSETVLASLPPQRITDTLYFDPSDREYPIGFNPLIGVNEYEHARCASRLVDVLRSIWADSWGPRLENLLMQSIRAVLYRSDPTLLSVSRLLTSPRFRADTIRRVRDPAVRAFWVEQYASWNERYRVEASAPVLNKLDRLTTNPTTRLILGQTRSAFSVRRIMDERRILIANLSRGSLGSEVSRLLGALLVATFTGEAFSREQGSATPHTLYVDEIQAFAAGSFTQLLSEARKYGLALCGATQFSSQLTPEIRASLFGNVGTLVAFRVGQDDAEILHRQFGREIEPGALTTLPPFEAFVQRASDPTPVPSRVAMSPPLADHTSLRHDRAAAVRARTRSQFARPRKKVEARLDRFFGG